MKFKRKKVRPVRDVDTKFGLGFIYKIKQDNSKLNIFFFFNLLYLRCQLY